MKPSLLKLLIACNLLLAVATLSMAGFAYQQQQFHSAQLTQFRQATDLTAAALNCPDWVAESNALSPQHPTQLSTLEATLKQLSTQARATQDELTNTRSLLDGTRTVLKKTEEDVLKGEEERSTLASQKEEAIAELTKQIESAKQVKADLADLRKTLRTTEQNRSLAQQKSLRLTDQVDELNVEVDKLKASLANLESNEEEEPSITPVKTPVHVAAGRVLKVDPKWHSVIINRGSKDSLPLHTKGFVHREGRLVATLTVTRLEDHMAVCDVMSDDAVTDIQPGDPVFF